MTKHDARVTLAGIAAVRHGDLWVMDGSGRPPQQITRGGSFGSVTAGEGGVAAVNGAKGEGPKTNVFAWRPHDPLARQVTQAGNFAGTPLWLPGTGDLLAGRLKPDADGGLWRVDTRSGAVYRVLLDYDADFPVNNHLLLSPSGRRVVSFTGSQTGMAIQVLEVKTLAPLRPAVSNDPEGLTDIAWLDDDTLLLSGDGGAGTDFPGAGGIRALDLRTRHLSRWLYSADTDVHQLVRAPGGSTLFAVGLGHVPGEDKAGSRHIRLFDARTKTGRPLALPCSAVLCGFSRDGSRLLVLMPARPGGAARNAYAVDVRTGAQHLLLTDVSDAVWR